MSIQTDGLYGMSDRSCKVRVSIDTDVMGKVREALKGSKNCYVLMNIQQQVAECERRLIA